MSKFVDCFSSLSSPLSCCTGIGLGFLSVAFRLVRAIGTDCNITGDDDVSVFNFDLDMDFDKKENDFFCAKTGVLGAVLKGERHKVGLCSIIEMRLASSA